DQGHLLEVGAQSLRLLGLLAFRRVGLFAFRRVGLLVLRRVRFRLSVLGLVVLGRGGVLRRVAHKTPSFIAGLHPTLVTWVTLGGAERLLRDVRRRDAWPPRAWVDEPANGGS